MDSKTLSSRLRELIKFLGTVKGDLANVTGPPSLLAPSSVVEVGHCWAQHPSVLSAPASEPDPEKRALLVLRWFLIALRSQLYVGVEHHTSSSDRNGNHNKSATTAANRSIRKPLNAFLGELFLARWTDEAAGCTTRLVAEQVSHHPPITAMHVSSSSIDEDGEAHEVRADGYARVEMTFNGGGVHIRQVGHATLRVERFAEDYLIPLPDVKVRGFLAGCLYPEISGTYHIVSNSGLVAEIRFWGEGMLFGGKRNSFEAKIFRKEEGEEGVGRKKEPIYEVTGCWSEGWTVKDGRTGVVLETYQVDAPENEPAPMEMEPLEMQDPWESRRAWAQVLCGLNMGDMRTVVAEKTKIEQAQRQMRASEAARGITWEPLFFRSQRPENHHVFHRLSKGLSWQLHSDKTKGVWRVDDRRVKNMQRPFRGELTPFGY